MSHTPTPWKIAPGHAPSSVTVRSDGDPSLPVAEIWHTDVAPEANAAFIVKACNAHDDLVEALKLAETHIDSVCGETSEGDLPEWFASLVTIRAALAKAEGRTP